MYYNITITQNIAKYYSIFIAALTLTIATV